LYIERPRWSWFLDSAPRACDKCAQEKRKTITGDDILFAMATLGFDNYIDPLRLYLQKYREVHVYM